MEGREQLPVQNPDNAWLWAGGFLDTPVPHPGSLTDTGSQVWAVQGAARKGAQTCGAVIVQQQRGM